jgi:hypothetical protein
MSPSNKNGKVYLATCRALSNFAFGQLLLEISIAGIGREFQN